MANLLYQELFEKHRLSEKIFLSLQNQHTVTYKEYINLVEKISFFFKEKGLNPGDRVALKLKKSHYFGGCLALWTDLVVRLQFEHRHCYHRYDIVRSWD